MFHPWWPWILLFFILCNLNSSLNQNNTILPEKEQPKQVCVIGAGYSGLAVARYMRQYGLNFTVFEATKHIGGTWRFDPHIGHDEDGVPVYTSMYKGLRTNVPRHTMEFAGFPMPENTPTFPSGECFYRYIKSFAKHFDILQYIQFHSQVTSVSWAEDHWDLTYTNINKKGSHRASCNFVVVSNAQRFSTPNYPKYKGLDSFLGTQIHSHDYRDSKPYVNRRVLIVGAGPSGLDLSMILSNITLKLIHSHHRSIRPTSTLKQYNTKPDIDSFTSNGVNFKDGSFEEIDDIIFCTGYLMSHEFLENAGVISNPKFVMPLYQHMINIIHPTMSFVGLARRLISRTLDAQEQVRLLSTPPNECGRTKSNVEAFCSFDPKLEAEYTAKLVAQKFKLPSREEMMKSWVDHMTSLLASGKKIDDLNVVDEELGSYSEQLSREAGITKIPPVLLHMKTFNSKNRLEDWLNFRNYDFEILDNENFTRRYNPRHKTDCP